MPSHERLEPSAPWIRLTTTQQDWDAADPGLLTTMLVQMQVIRSFEEAVLGLAGEGLVHGPAHSSIGQEGGAVGSAVALRTGDAVNGTHRGHHQFLAKALAHLAGPDGTMDPTAPLGADVRELLQRTLAEILGLESGFSHGRGGSMHLRWAEAGCLGTNAIVGGGVPLAAGHAFNQKRSGTDVSFTYFGDGASNIGSTLETLNLAAAWKLPLCFFVENNLYAVSTFVEDVTGDPRLSGRGPGFGIPAWRVDGMDPLAVHLATQEATERMRAGEGPTLIEAEVYRFFHQNGPFPGSAFGYRSKAEEKEWKGRDPIALTDSHVQRRGLLSQEQIDAMVAEVTAACAAAVDALTELDPEGENGKRRIKPALWPSTDFVDVGIRSDASALAGARSLELADVPEAEVSQRRLVDVVAEVMHRRMEQDQRIVVMGEDVHRLKGGTNGATRGLVEDFGDRVLGTPIAENAFTGLAGGMAMDGRFRPVVEFMYADFMWVAADQLFNQVGKARHMFGGDVDMPFVLRSKVAMGTGYGSQHSMDPAGVFATQPGWRIAAPSTPFDYVGLMNAALTLEDPVVVLEHVNLYGQQGPAVADLDYVIEPGKAAVRREGQDVTVLTYLDMVAPSLAAAETAALDAEVIDLRWLDRASIDWDTIGASIEKTNAVMIVEQGARNAGYGAWLADELQRRFFDHLDAPIERVTGAEASPSISQVLESAAFAHQHDVESGFARLAAQLGR